METPRKFIIAELSIRKLGSSSVLIILLLALIINIISTDEDPSLRIESSAIINLRGVSTKLNKYIVFTMQTYKKNEGYFIPSQLKIHDCCYYVKIIWKFAEINQPYCEQEHIKMTKLNEVVA